MRVYPRVVDLGIENHRPLELRVGRLIAKLGEAGDRLRVQRANEGRVGGQARNVELCEQRRLAGLVWRLATLVICPGETEVQQLVLADDPRRATFNLAVL